MDKENNKNKIFLWNIIGSATYSVSSFLYLLVVTRFCGVEIAGFFSLSYATAQLLLQVGRYGMRTYQATDLEQKYLFSEYAFSRVLTCGLMMFIGIIYCNISFDKEYVVIGSFIILMKVIDAIEDVFHGNFQQKYHIETMGKILALRNIYSIMSFSGILFFTRNLMTTCIFTSISSLAFCLYVNGYFTNKQGMKDKNRNRLFSIYRVLELIKNCTPFFIGTFLSILLYNIPKYAMSNIMGNEYQTYYSILFMPSFAITLLCEFVFKPMMTTIAELWLKNKMERFLFYVVRILTAVSIFCVAIIIGGHFLGRTLLENIYGVDLSSYKLHFVVLLLGGGISSGVYMLYNILIAIRKGNCIIVVYCIATLFTLIPSQQMVIKYGMMGATLNYLLSSSILFVIFLFMFIYVYLQKKSLMAQNIQKL